MPPAIEAVAPTRVDLAGGTLDIWPVYLMLDGPITVNLQTYHHGTTVNPIGLIDTPLDNTTGVTGSIPFTGWALDDIEVANVFICRNNVAGEPAPIDPNCGGNAQIFVGAGVFIDGSRTDVQAAAPTYPVSHRAGWGFMVLTNMLPNQGNGTYVFHAYAIDREGQVRVLGTRTLVVDNANATVPFGTIDTPGQGDTVSGNQFVNFGWALTQQPKVIPFNGSTISVASMRRASRMFAGSGGRAMVRSTCWPLRYSRTAPSRCVPSTRALSNSTGCSSKTAMI